MNPQMHPEMDPVDEDRALAGAYDPASYDPASADMHRHQTVDPTTRHLTWIACLIAGALVVLIGSWMLLGRQRGTVPVIEAAAGPVRIKPVDPGGMQALGAPAPMVGSPNGSESLAPPPEEARPEALQAQLDAARQSALQPPPMVPPAGPASAPALVAPAPYHRPAARPLQTSPGPEAVPLDVPQEPAGSPAHEELHTDAAPSGPGAGTGAHAVAVQLAALGSHQAAQSEWSRLRRNHPSLFSGRRAVVEQADHDGRLIYRLRTRGFASLAAAHSFCLQARAQRVACTVADF